MGLDQYAYINTGDFEEDLNNNKFQWRKHARLHTFMVEHKSYDKDNDTLNITNSILDELEEAIEDKYDEYFCRDGFFWGHQFQEKNRDFYESLDLEFVKWTREQLSNNKIVTYYASY